MASSAEPKLEKKEVEEENPSATADDEDTGAQVAPIVKLQEVAVSTGEENEDVLLDLLVSPNLLFHSFPHLKSIDLFIIFFQKKKTLSSSRLHKILLCLNTNLVGVGYMNGR